MSAYSQYLTDLTDSQWDHLLDLLSDRRWRPDDPGRLSRNVRQFSIYDAGDQLKNLLVGDLVIERQVSVADTLIFMENNDAK